MHASLDLEWILVLLQASKHHTFVSRHWGNNRPEPVDLKKKNPLTLKFTPRQRSTSNNTKVLSGIQWHST